MTAAPDSDKSAGIFDLMVSGCIGIRDNNEPEDQNR